MADGLIANIWGDVEHLIVKAAQDMFGTGQKGGNPDSIRWEGMTNAQLAAAVRELSSGPGASAIQQAADALSTIAGNLQHIDSTLHDQLAAIGINWQSTAGELAQEMTTAAAAYSAGAGAAGGANAAAMGAQGDAYAAARNAVPNPSTLTQPAGFPGGAGGGQSLIGHENDQARQAAAANTARQQAIDTMTGYGSSSQAGLSGFKPLPPPPTVSVQQVGGGIPQVTSVSGFVPPTQGVSGFGGNGSGSSFPGGASPGTGGGAVPGSPGLGLPGEPLTGLGVPGQMPPGSGFPGVPGGGMPGVPGGGGGGVPGLPMPGAPGGGGFGGGGGGGGGGAIGPLGPGPISGIGGPGAVSGAGGSAAAIGAAATGSFVEDTAIGGAIVGGAAAAGIGGAAARRDELVRTRDLGEGEPEGEGDARQQAARALAELEGDEAAEAAVSERIGAVAEPAPSLLEPIMGRRRDDEEEHSNRYATDDEMFDDGRMVVPPVLGGDSDDSK